MTDEIPPDARDRIAKTLSLRHDTAVWSRVEETVKVDWYEEADAILRALRVPQEVRE